MIEQNIIELFANGDVYGAINQAHEQGFMDLANNFKKSIGVFDDPDTYRDHYKKDNARIPGQQITDNWGADLRQRKAMEHIKLLGGSNLLDVGCADGSFIFLCLRSGIIKRAIGIDPWYNGILWAKRYALTNSMSDRVSFFQGIFEDQQIQSDFDVIHLGEVLEHAMNPVDLIKKAMSFTKNLKGIVITVPIGRPPITDAEKNILINGSPAEHIRQVTLDTIKSYCEKLSLSIDKTDTVGSGWVNLVVTLKGV